MNLKRITTKEVRSGTWIETKSIYHKFTLSLDRYKLLQIPIQIFCTTINSWLSFIHQALLCSDVTALVAHPRMYSVQIGGPGPPSSSRQRSRIPQIVHSTVWHAQSIITPFFIIQPCSRPPVRRSTVCAWVFPVSEPALWNSLPADITSIDSLPVFRHRLKNYLFSHSYPGAVQ